MQLGQREERRPGGWPGKSWHPGGLAPFPQGGWEPWRAGRVWAQRGQDPTWGSQSFFSALLLRGSSAGREGHTQPCCHLYEELDRGARSRDHPLLFPNCLAHTATAPRR